MTRAAATFGVALLGMLAGSAPALAADGEYVRASGVPFGILGPVGMVAVAVGVLGMAVGVARSRKKAAAERLAAQAAAERLAAQPRAEYPDDATRPVLTPVRRSPAA
ncbi:hypothetical protein CFN78_01980 [Amycolatopsis antarctica]|uniref:Uncharacterized protein n=1 Tax=Amycolatopsis antarctica TaxID=1854586 RepID=A0A263D8Y8_9PSEU|nr:hypothetical protein [Amycolatopsis antarctica]OZM74984.1 hypothetical protein CFN78_01980 [Amycolatopsis antarctica]